MNKEQLKKDHPDLYNEVFGLGEAKARLDFTKTETTLTEQNEALRTTVTELSETVRSRGEEMDKLSKKVEKEEALKLAARLKGEADKVWKEKLSDSEIPDYLHEKVSRMVSHEKFVEDGKLDTEKIGAAIDAEIKDWESRFTSEETTGFGKNKKEEFGANDDADDASWENEMAGYAGVQLQQ